MSKKLQGNGLWESSRMMLPEHKEQIWGRRREQRKRIRPTLEQDQLDRFAQLISDSIMQGQPLQFILFDEWEEARIVGRVQHIDRLRNVIQIVSGEENSDTPTTAIRLADIMDIAEVIDNY